jgi:hypothetical protein
MQVDLGPDQDVAGCQNSLAQARDIKAENEKWVSLEKGKGVIV